MLLSQRGLPGPDPLIAQPKGRGRRFLSAPALAPQAFPLSSATMSGPRTVIFLTSNETFVKLLRLEEGVPADDRKLLLGHKERHKH